jgi:hypothetical protein
MEEALINISYLGVDGQIEGLKCPKCDASYITEDIATGKLARGEKLIEEK